MAVEPSSLLADPELQETSWDLDPLVHGRGADGVKELLAKADELATSFAERYQGRVGELDASGLIEAMHAAVQMYEDVDRAASYAYLRFSTDTADPERGALLQLVQERGTAIETKVLFFELEWAALPDERAGELLAADGLDFARHYLEKARRYRPHLLSEPEERIVAEKSVSGRGAWTRLFSEVTSAITVRLPDAAQEGDDEAGEVSLEVALSKLQSPDRDVRRGAAEAITEGLAPGLRTRAFIFNTLMHDKAVDDRLRNYPTWVSSRNLSNEASDESVQALVEAVRARNDIPRRWYTLKARLLGLDQLADYDRVAAVSQDEAAVPWGEARSLVTDCYEGFSHELGAIVRRFFDERHVDAPVRPGKRGGAFCASTVPELTPYVMLNYTAQRQDVLTLAHELGHGVHGALAARQGILQMSTPLTMAETASVFGEQITFARLLETADSAESRLALLARSVEGAIATVFRQTAMNRFEELAHTARRGEGELSVERIGELWGESQEELLGDSVQVTPGYLSWWSYVPHFMSTPGYVYAYAYGQLLAMSVYRRYEEEGPSFVPRYLELLGAGGSRAPEELAAIAGLDLTDPAFWDSGLALVEQKLEAAEAAARETGRI
ncbi:MAG: oligoendopeptidase [Thermoleophilaceae bacterium]|jgi:oligoendopeptidase F|nr:oligoendopeptidase [Thermoleophilaceae bacterium]